MRGRRAQLDLQSIALVVFVAVESANVRRDDMLSTDNNAKGAGWMSGMDVENDENNESHKTSKKGEKDVCS